MDRIRVLWVEDGAAGEFANIGGPLHTEPAVSLAIAFNASDAVHRLLSSEFDVVIVDVRLPPGEDWRWIALYDERGREAAQAQLGIELVRSAMAHAEARIVLKRRPSWLSATRFALLTVEHREEMRALVGPLGVTKIYEKDDVYKSTSSDCPLAIRILKEVLSAQGKSWEFGWYD